MKKILLVSNSTGVKSATLDFASYIARLGKSRLIGIFAGEENEYVPFVGSPEGGTYIETIPRNDTERKEIAERLNKSMQSFKEGCIQREVYSDVRQYSSDALESIIMETRYADLIIIDLSVSFNQDECVPSKSALEILHNAECPVLVAPEIFDIPAEIIFAYDDNASAVFAIKQFCLQLPELAGEKITVLHISTGEPDTDLSDEKKSAFKEWLDLHFNDYSFLEIAGDPKEELFKYFLEHNQQNNKLLVTGALGRNAVSSLFRKSSAELILKAVDIPIFIAHI